MRAVPILSKPWNIREPQCVCAVIPAGLGARHGLEWESNSKPGSAGQGIQSCRILTRLCVLLMCTEGNREN